jgi:hypothetical protein
MDHFLKDMDFLVPWCRYSVLKIVQIRVAI